MALQPSREELFVLAFQDDLTGLYNRRYLQKTLAPSLEEASSQSQSPYCFLLLDIDYFKEINDTYGHKDGDRALVSVAELLTDSAQDDQTVIRYAGDEFIVFLPGFVQQKGLERATEIVEKGRAIAVPLNGGAKSIRLSFSVGVASFPQDGTCWQTIVEKADEALYAAKQKGRDRASLPPEDGSEIRRGDDLSRIFPCPDHVGRERTVEKILGFLRKQKDAQLEARERFLLIQGERGSGKSRLLDEVVEAADKESTRVIRLQGSEQMQDVSYGGLIHGLIEFAGTQEDLSRRIEGILSEEDDPLWETFFTRKEDTDFKPICEEEAHRFFIRILTGIADGSPLVLLVDDTDLLDRETLHLFRILRDSPSQEWAFSALLTAKEVASESNASGTDSSPVHESDLHVIFSESSASPIVLEPLGVDGVEKMVKSILPTLRAGPVFSTRLHDQSCGNPLYIEEALKLLIQTGNLVYERSAWNWSGKGLEELPETLGSLLEARLCSLDPEVREVLAKASMMGPAIDAEILKEIEGINEGYLMDLLDRARKIGVLEERSGWGRETFKFSSKMAREFCYDQIPEQERISWHLRMAELSELLGETPLHLRIGPILHHYRMAGEDSRYQEALQRLTRVSSSSDITLPASFSSKKKGDHGTPVPLAGQGWNKILSIFHLLRAAVQNARLYPETSQAVAQSCERLMDGFEQAFRHTPSVHLSEAEGTLLVNGETPSWKGEEITVADNFCKSLSIAGLKDISFHQGLSLQEIKSFLVVWLSVMNRTAEPSTAWSAFEDQAGMDHVRINTKVYVAVSDAGLLTSGLQAPLPVQAGGSLDEVSDLLSSLQEQVDSFRNPAALSGPTPDEVNHFRKLLETIQLLVESAGPESAPAPLPLQHRPESAASPQPEDAVESQPWNPERVEDTDVRSALADILSGEPERENRGYKTISKRGKQAIEPLYFFLTQTDDAHAGRLCAGFLKSLSTDLSARIRADLERHSEPSVKKRLLQYGIALLDSELERKQVLQAALQLEDRPVAMEALLQIRTDFPSDAPSLLLELLPVLSDRMRSEVCATLGHIQDPGTVPQLLDYLNQWKTLKNSEKTRFQESVCHALGHFHDSEIVKTLGDLLVSNSWIPWRRTAPLNLRKAALKALEMIGGESVRSLLKRAESDRDPWIRYRIKHYLGRQAG